MLNSAETQHTLSESDAQLELFWDATYAIVVSLIDAYPKRSPEALGLDEIATLIEQLPGFADDPALVTDQMLLDIQTTWYEELHT